MEHLLDGDAGKRLAPPPDRLRLPRGQALIGIRLQAEAGVQVLTHDQVLQLRRLDQQIPLVLTVLDNKLRLCHPCSRGRLAH